MMGLSATGERHPASQFPEALRSPSRRFGRRQQQGNRKIPRNFAKPDVLLR